MSETFRHDRRITINVPVEYEGFERFERDRLLNLGPGGAFVISNHPLEPGRKVRMKFELPDLHLPVLVTGVVLWSRPRPQGKISLHPPGMAIRFDEEYEKLKELLELYVDVEKEVNSVFNALDSLEENVEPVLHEVVNSKN